MSHDKERVPSGSTCTCGARMENVLPGQRRWNRMQVALIVAEHADHGPFKHRIGMLARGSRPDMRRRADNQEGAAILGDVAGVDGDGSPVFQGHGTLLYDCHG